MSLNDQWTMLQQRKMNIENLIEQCEEKIEEFQANLRKINRKIKSKKFKRINAAYRRLINSNPVWQ